MNQINEFNKSSAANSLEFPNLVLMYHNMVDSDKNLRLYDVSLAEFKSQIEEIKRKKEKGKSECIVTFDDGYSCWSNEVLDILKQNKIKGYFFICINMLNEGLISKEDIIKLRQNGMIIGSHSVTHRFLHTLTAAEVFSELNESKKILEEIIQDEIQYFSIPRGPYTKTVIETAKKVGYRNVFSSDCGINNNSTFLLKRFPIKRTTTLDEFKDILDGKINEKMLFNQKLKDLGKKALGINAYNRLRRILVPRVE